MGRSSNFGLATTALSTPVTGLGKSGGGITGAGTSFFGGKTGSGGGLGFGGGFGRTIFGSFFKGAGAGLVGGYLESAKEGARLFHSGPLSKIAGEAADQAMEAAPVLGRRSGAAFLDRYFGSVTKGLMPDLALKPIAGSKIPDAIAGGKNFAADIAGLASQGRYVEIADRANEFFEYPNIQDKEKFGKAFADNVKAISGNEMTMGRLFYNLNDMAEKGGAKTLPEDFVRIAKNAEFNAGLLAAETGIMLPETPFHPSTLQFLPELEKPALSFQQGYELKSTLGEIIERAPVRPETDVIEGTKALAKPEGVEEIAKKYVKTITKDYDTADSLREKLIAESNKVISAYDPETIGKISRIAEENEIRNYRVMEPERIKLTDTNAPIHVKHIFADQEGNMKDDDARG